MAFTHGPNHPLPKQNGAPSNLATVLLQISQAFSAMADGTPVMVGKHYLEHNGAGSDPRVLFVPEPGAGKIGPPHEMGNAASMTHACDVYVRAGETQDDISRFSASYDLADIVISCISSAGTGRLSWGAMVDNSPVTAPSGFGAELKFSFTFTRDIRHGARGRLPSATASNAPVSLQPPDNREGSGAEPGENAPVTDLTPTVTPVEE